MIFKRTLKNKIQGSMFKTAGITLLISLSIILPMLYMSLIPIAAFISESVNDSIVQKYTMNFEAEMKSVRKWQGENRIEELTVNELSVLINDTINETLIDEDHIMNEMMFLEEEQSIIVESLEEHSQKRFMLSILTVLREINEYIPLKKYTDIDVIIIEFKYGDKQVLCVPQNLDAGLATGIRHFEELKNMPKNNGFFDEKLLEIYNDSKSILNIYDENGNTIGTITTAINPVFIFFTMTPIIMVFIVSGFLALIVAAIMSKLLTIPILKPINLLNIQLAAIVSDDYALSKDIHVELKKPPKEIENLRDNTNRIMKKMKSYYVDLEENKDELEAQNAELEAQNIELYESKKLIEDQRTQLVQNEKMASIGQLSAAIAHEINTPLGAIKSNCQMTETILPIIEKAVSEIEEPKVKKAIKNLKNSNTTSLDASKRMIEIIRNLKNFSRLDQSDYQDADLNEGIESVLVLSSNLWKNKVEIIKEFNDIPLVPCYPSMLNQVFMNILVNAIHASEQNSKIIIRTIVEEESIIIEFQDFGEGISKEQIRHIFESGFTTKAKNNGTGLGLAISKEIIEKHNGSINVESTVGEGTVFTIKLPLKVK